MNKKLLALVCAVAIGAVAWFAAGNALQQAVQIPNEINLFITGLVFAAVTAGFSWLFNFIGLDLRSLTDAVAGVLSLWVVTELQGWVNLIPDIYDPYISILFKIIVVVIGGLGTLHVIARARGSQSLLR